MTQGAALVVRGLGKSFGAVPAVKDFNLETGRGEFISLVGPSGCGKTTILRMIAGLIEPSEGGIFLDGQDITWKAVHLRHFGLLFQSYALFPHLNIFENIAFGLRRRRVAESDIRRRVNNALEQVRLPDLGERHPNQLSGGQQQRVALARAIVTEPSLLLLDEPLSNLDALLRNEMQIELKRLQASLGVTTILVTHDQSEALTMSDRIVVLSKGHLEQVGTPEEIYRTPASPFVRHFVGRTNFLPAQVRAVEGAVARVALKGGAEFLAAIPASWPGGGLLGEDVQVALRHEQPRIVSSRDGHAQNSIPATVLFRAFAGPSTQYVVQLGQDGPEMQVEVTSGKGDWAVGDPVYVEWAAGDAVVCFGGRDQQ